MINNNVHCFECESIENLEYIKKYQVYFCSKCKEKMFQKL